MRKVGKFPWRSAGDGPAADVRRSALFDARWYLGTYADVRAAGVDPAEHYLTYGAKEGRDPGPRFSTAAYLRQHPEVAETGENPVLHFARVYGRLPTAEGVERFSVDLVDPPRDRWLNRVEAAADPDGVARARDSLEAFLGALPAPSLPPDGKPVPKAFHFVYGFKGDRRLPYYGYLAIQSALHFNPGWSAFYYAPAEPEGPHWERIRDRVRFVAVKDFDYFMGARLRHYAHKADVVRLLAVNRIGGVYLDVDTLTRRSYDDLRGHDFVMGVQAAGPDSSSGLANAVLVGRPGARFSTEWLARYDHFRSRGRDHLWDFHSVKMPVSMSVQQPDSVTVLDYRAFFYPLWNVADKYLLQEGSIRFLKEFEAAYCFHLWNGRFGALLESLDEEYVRSSASVYAHVARQAEGLV